MFEASDAVSAAGLTPVSAMARPGRTPVAPLESRSSNERLIACTRYDASRLALVLRRLRCNAALRTADGTVVALTPGVSCAAGDGGGCAGHSAPVYDERGEPIASLEVTSCELGISDVVHKILKLLIDAVAHSIAERLFRLCHRRHWIFAAQCVGDPEKVILLALDREQRVIAADSNARRLLASRGRRFDESVSLLTFFQASDRPIRGRQYCDVTMNLMGAEDGAEWTALITAPDAHAGTANEERALLQACPRVDTLGCVETQAPEPRKGGGLPPRALSRIQEYVETHLATTLGVDELASVVGMSVSNFGRRFRWSVGLTPHGYVMRRRLLRAQELLADTNLELVEIALRTGFADQSHFSRRFHELTGVPPNRFRGQHR
jgi:AraC-like DNA-binding protein